MRNYIGTKLILTCLFIAMGLLLPTIFHITGISGLVFLPMHLPVLLCGLICGVRLGGITGFLIPLLCSVLSGKPMLYPLGTCMMLELAAYGIISGALAKKSNTLVALIAAMLGGRIVLGVVQLLILGFNLEAFAINAFLSETFVTALPGIIIQITLIPILIMVLKRAKLLPIRS